MTEQLYNKIKDPLLELFDCILRDLGYGHFNTSIDYRTGVHYHYKEYEDTIKVTNEITITFNFVEDDYYLEMSKYDNNDIIDTFNKSNNFKDFCIGLHLDLETDYNVFKKDTHDIMDKLLTTLE